MSGVEHREVAADDAGIRLDRWFKRHFPVVSHIQLEKLLRTGQVRVDGGRVKANARLEAGQLIRIPPLPAAAPGAERPRRRDEIADARLSKELQGLVIYQNDAFVALNKPAGLAVQGGSGTTHHLDLMIEAHEAVTGERWRLVHRLDRDTSGLLLLARTPGNAAALAELFRHRAVEKRYWALTTGVPKVQSGRIDKALAKRVQSARQGREAMTVADPEDDDAQRAITDYVVMGYAGPIGWVALRPLTGRTHQLRAHMGALGTPIVGDRKYGGEEAQIGGVMPAGLMLHARMLTLPPKAPGVGAKPLTLTAPLSGAMKDAFKLLGFDGRNDTDPFD